MVLVNVPKEMDYERMIAQVQGGIEELNRRRNGCWIYMLPELSPLRNSRNATMA